MEKLSPKKVNLLSSSMLSYLGLFYNFYSLNSVSFAYNSVLMNVKMFVGI